MKRRWTENENVAFSSAFRENLERNINLTSSAIQNAKQDLPILMSRSDSLLRTRMNNIVKGKQKFSYTK